MRLPRFTYRPNPWVAFALIAALCVPLFHFVGHEHSWCDFHQRVEHTDGPSHEGHHVHQDFTHVSRATWTEPHPLASTEEECSLLALIRTRGRDELGTPADSVSSLDFFTPPSTQSPVGAQPRRLTTATNEPTWSLAPKNSPPHKA